MITDTAIFRYAYYHTPQDTADKADFEKNSSSDQGHSGVSCRAGVARKLTAIIASIYIHSSPSKFFYNILVRVSSSP